MSDMKCPVCDSYLHKIPVKEAWVCGTHDTKDKLYGSKELWQELIRTRKALDVALCSLQDIAESNGDFITGASTPLDEHEYADMMLKEIKRQMKIKTALEQKDR